MAELHWCLFLNDRRRYENWGQARVVPFFLIKFLNCRHERETWRGKKIVKKLQRSRRRRNFFLVTCYYLTFPTLCLLVLLLLLLLLYVFLSISSVCFVLFSFVSFIHLKSISLFIFSTFFHQTILARVLWWNSSLSTYISIKYTQSIPHLSLNSTLLFAWRHL